MLKQSGRLFVTGVCDPIIAISEDIAVGLSADELEDVLTHEGAHLARRDLLTGILQAIIGVVFWICPWVHVLNRALAKAREEVCDSFVLANRAAADYARTLLKIGAMLYGQGPQFPAVSMATSKPSLRQRVEALLGDKQQRKETHTMHPRLLISTAAACALLACVVAPLVPYAETAAAAATTPQPSARNQKAPTAPICESVRTNRVAETLPEGAVAASVISAPQITVAAKFVEVDAATAESITPLKDAVGGRGLAATEAAAILKQLKQAPGTDILCAPKVTTHSHQTAIIKMVEERFFPKAAGDGEGKVEPTEIGVSLEVTPRFLSDSGGAIRLSLRPKVTEFLGMEKFVSDSGETVKMPIISTREINTELVMKNGETVVLGGMVTQRERENIGETFGDGKKTVAVKRQLMVFVTAEIVDATGVPITP